MAMILCPECGAAISDRAPSCPQCGVPAPADLLVTTTLQAQRIEARARALHHAKYAALLLWLPFWGLPTLLTPMSEDAVFYWLVAHFAFLAALYAWTRRWFLRKWGRQYGAPTR
jgi:hypothetical protein